MFDFQHLIGKATTLLQDTSIADLIRDNGGEDLLERSGYDFARLDQFIDAQFSEGVGDADLDNVVPDAGSVSQVVTEKVEQLGS